MTAFKSSLSIAAFKSSSCEVSRPASSGYPLPLPDDRVVGILSSYPSWLSSSNGLLSGKLLRGVLGDEGRTTIGLRLLPRLALLQFEPPIWSIGDSEASCQIFLTPSGILSSRPRASIDEGCESDARELEGSAVVADDSADADRKDEDEDEAGFPPPVPDGSTRGRLSHHSGCLELRYIKEKKVFETRLVDYSSSLVGNGGKLRRILYRVTQAAFHTFVMRRFHRHFWRTLAEIE